MWGNIRHSKEPIWIAFAIGRPKIKKKNYNRFYIFVDFVFEEVIWEPGEHSEGANE